MSAPWWPAGDLPRDRRVRALLALAEAASDYDVEPAVRGLLPWLADPMSPDSVWGFAGIAADLESAARIESLMDDPAEFLDPGERYSGSFNREAHADEIAATLRMDCIRRAGHLCAHDEAAAYASAA